jgi:hypothetical protein
MHIMAGRAAAVHPAHMPEPVTIPIAPATRKVHDAQRHPRLARELATLRAMVAIYCHDHHATARDALCRDCAELMAYATRRLDRCVFGDDKPTCANCKVHCYTAAMREQVRMVMRYAGPRMLRRHPLLSIAHLVDGRREAPELPKRRG